jgi:uncharacterized damage-inducible protein DinB
MMTNLKEHDMSLAESMIQEFTQESATTKKLLERLPNDKLAWKPHEKSMTIGRLATHIAEMPTWATSITGSAELDLAAGGERPTALGSQKEILDRFQECVDGFAKALAGKSDQELLRSWKLKNGSHVILELPRVVALRSLVMNHIIHHRGQLSVYLRLNNIPVPSIYGPSADES